MTQSQENWAAVWAEVLRPENHDIIIITNGIDCLLGTPTYADVPSYGTLINIRIQAVALDDWLENVVPNNSEDEETMKQAHAWLGNLQTMVSAMCMLATDMNNNCPQIP